MSKLQQCVFELEMDYAGHPYYVSGNAILHAMADQLSYETQQQIAVSHGMFAPGQFGKYPTEHSQDGTRPYMGQSLPDVEAYDDLFLTRSPDQRWLLDSRPRDAINTPDLKVQGQRPIMAREKNLSKTSSWCVHCYITSDDDSLLPISSDVLDGLQFGGKRNYGYGITNLADTQVIDLDELDYSRITDADDHLIELVTPFVVESEFTRVDNQDIPWWWDYTHELRYRQEQIVEQRERYALRTVDHGQVVGYDGPDPVGTAKNGLQRVGPHSKYGFGEIRVKPLSGST